MHGIPLDVLWMDIGHTDNYQYFTFHPERFNENDMQDLKHTINESGRRLVVITDPHLKADDNYHVYNKAMDLINN